MNRFDEARMWVLSSLAVVIALVPQSAFGADDDRGAQQIERQMMEQICEGHMAAGADHEAHLECSECPSETDFKGQKQPFAVQRTFRGHFSAKGIEQILVTMLGCESHVRSWGGAYLFARQGESWEKVVYFPGHRPEDCLTFRGRDGLDRMACQWAEMHAGTGEAWITETAYLNNTVSDRVLIGDIDNNLGGGDKGAGYCFEQAITSFRKLSARRGFRTLVEQRKQAAPPEEFKPCGDQPLKGPFEKVTLDFLFDGYHFHLAPGMQSRLARVAGFWTRPKL